MRLGIDYRPVTAAPHSGIARQVLALEQGISALEQDHLLRFTAAPQDHAHRTVAICPSKLDSVEKLHRPLQRLHFEACFLPAALRLHYIDAYIATANRGLPIEPNPRRRRQVLLLHDLFQLSYPEPCTNALKRQAYLAIERASILYSVRRADLIWCPSRYTLDAVASRFPAQAHKLRLLPNAVARLPIMSPPTQALPTRYWLAVGTRGERKNLGSLIGAWQAAREASPAVPALVLVGSPADLPAQAGHDSGLQVQEAVSDAALAWIYHHAECLWHPAYAEGFGLPVVEALAQGLAVATALGSALDEITPPHAPRFDPDSLQAIIALMLQLGASPPANNPAATASRRDFAAAFEMETYTSRLKPLLTELRRCVRAS